MPATEEPYVRCPRPIVDVVRAAARALLGVSFEREPGQRGRPKTPLEKILNSVWHRLRTGCQWRAIPAGADLAKGTTAHRWFVRFSEAGVFEVLYAVVVALYLRDGLRRLRQLGIDCTLCSAPMGGKETGPNPTDRGKAGVKLSIVVDQHGRPIAIHLDAANIHDLKLLRPTLEQLARTVIDELDLNGVEIVADRGYDAASAREMLRHYGLKPCIPRRGRQRGRTSKRYRRMRAITERTCAWFKLFRGVRLCCAKRLRHHISQVQIAATYLLLLALPKRCFAGG